MFSEDNKHCRECFCVHVYIFIQMNAWTEKICVISVTTSPTQKTAHGLMTARVCRMIKEINDNLSD